MARLIIKRLFPGERSEKIKKSPITNIDVERYSSDGNALDRAKILIWDENQRQHKNPRKLPALVELQIERDDGSIMDDAAVRRLAPQIRD
jgi:hypothetical protein